MEIVEKNMCEFCRKQFNSTRGLSKHLAVVKCNIILKCDNCDKKFNRKDRLSKHIKSKRCINSNPYNICKHCHNWFATSQYLEKHIKICKNRPK